MFEYHEVVDEEDAFALEQLPDRLAPLPLGLRNVVRPHFVGTLTGKHEILPLGCL